MPPRCLPGTVDVVSAADSKQAMTLRLDEQDKSLLRALAHELRLPQQEVVRLALRHLGEERENARRSRVRDLIHQTARENAVALARLADS